jgi:hypothetical protein
MMLEWPLGLTARAPGKDQKVARHTEHRFRAEVLFDQSKSEVNSGGNPS